MNRDGLGYESVALHRRESDSGYEFWWGVRCARCQKTIGERWRVQEGQPLLGGVRQCPGCYAVINLTICENEFCGSEHCFNERDMVV